VIAGGGLAALGSAGEPHAAAQETWLRLSRADTGEVEHPSDWLIRDVARTARDTVSRNAGAKLYVMSGSASAARRRPGGGNRVARLVAAAGRAARGWSAGWIRGTPRRRRSVRQYREP